MIISSVLFGAAHFANPGARPLALVGVTLAGVVMAYAYIVTKRLWMPIGIHLGWNFALSPIFGFHVSGIDFPAWIEHTSRGPIWWLGGEFGPEAGIWVLIDLLITGLLVYWYGKTMGKSDETAAGTL